MIDEGFRISHKLKVEEKFEKFNRRFRELEDLMYRDFQFYLFLIESSKNGSPQRSPDTIKAPVFQIHMNETRSQLEVETHNGRI